MRWLTIFMLLPFLSSFPFRLFGGEYLCQIFASHECEFLYVCVYHVARLVVAVEAKEGSAADGSSSSSKSMSTTTPLLTTRTTLQTQ